MTERTGFPDSVISAGSLYTKPPLPVSGLTAGSQTESSITYTWTLPATEPVTGYRIYIKETGDVSYSIAGVVATGINTFTATSLESSSGYDAYAVAYNENDPLGDPAIPDAEAAASNIVTTSTTAETIPPTLLSWVISTDGLSSLLSFSESVSAAAVAGLAVTATSGAVTLTLVSVSGDTISVSHSRVINGPEVVTGAYTSPGGITDIAGNQLSSFTGFAVTNSSTVSPYKFWTNYETGLIPSGTTITAGTVPTDIVWNASSSEALEGIYSAKLIGSTGRFKHAFAAGASAGETHGFFAWRTNNKAASPFLFRLLAAADAVLIQLRVSSSNLRASDAGGTTLATGTGSPVTDNQVLYIWWTYKPGSGSNGIFTLWHSATKTKPGSASISLTAGVWTADAIAFEPRVGVASTTGLYDEIKISDSTIGSNPL